MAANVTQNMLDKLANQAQYNNPQIKSLSNMTAKMLGAESLDTLPPGVQNFLSQILYVMANNYGDQMGLLHMGNLFANMHQGVISSGGMPAMGMNGSLLGVSRGAGARSAQLADMYSQIAQQYYMTGSGATITDHIHGMSANVFTGLAGAVVKDRGVQQGDSKILRTQKGYQGIQMAINEIEKSQGKAGAIDKGSNEYKALVDLSRVTREYERLAEHNPETAKIKRLEAEIGELDNKERNGGTLTDEEKRTRRAMMQDLSQARQARTNGIKAELKGKDIGEETINGQKFGKLRMSEEMLDMAAEQYNNGGTQAELMTTKARKEVQEAIRKTSKNVAELEKIFGTNDFAELQNIAKQLGMGSISDANNVAQVTKRIREAQVMAQKSGRSIQSIFTEQGALLGTYSQIYGGQSRVDANAITFNQRISTQAEQDTKNFGGRGATKEESSAEAVASEAAYLDETKQVQLARYALKGNDYLNLTDEQRSEIQGLLSAYDNASSIEERRAIYARIAAWNVDNNDMSKSAQYEARTMYGHDEVVKEQRAIARSNFETAAKRLGRGQREVLAKEGVDVTNERTRKKLGDIFEQLDNADLAGADKIAEMANEDDRKAAIQGMLDSSGLTGEDRAQYENALREYVKLGEGTRKFMRRTGMRDAHMQNRTSKAGMARAERETAIADLKTKLAEGGELPLSGMEAFKEGLLSGDTEVTDRDVVLSSLSQNGFYNQETGAVDQEAINRLNNDPEMSKAMFALSVDTETGAIKNTDLLDKEIQGPDGKKMPMWKLLGKTKEEALNNAKDPAKVNKMMNTLSNKYGLTGTSIGGGNMVFAQGSTIQKGREELEKTRKEEGTAHKIKKALGDHMTDYKLDKEGNIISATIDGTPAKSKEEVDAAIAKVAKEDPAIAEALKGIKDTGKKKNKNTEKVQDAIAMQEYGKVLLGNQTGLENKSYDSEGAWRNDWTGSAEDIKHWGTKENYDRQRQMRKAIKNAAEDVSSSDLKAAKRKYFAAQGFSGKDLEKKMEEDVNSAQMMEILMTGKGADGKALLSKDKRDKLKGMMETNRQKGDGGTGAGGGEGDIGGVPKVFFMAANAMLQLAACIKGGKLQVDD